MKLVDFMHYKRNILISLLAGVLVGISACDGVDRSSEEYLESAQVYLDKNNFASAVVELKSALQQDINNVEARNLLGDVYLQVGKGEDAEKEIRRAISLGMSPSSGATSLAQALLLQGEFQQVLDSPVELGASSKTEQAKLLALRGNAHLALGNLTIAENSYDRALSLDGNSRYALMGKARMKATRGDFDGAKVIASKVTADAPAFAPIWELLGDIELAQDQLDSAEAMYTKAIKQGHYLSESTLKRAGVRLQQEDYVALKEDTDTLIEAGYQSPHLFYFKGRVDFFNKAYSDAEDAFKATLELNSKFWPAKVYLASTHLFLGQQQQALDLAQQLQSDASDQNYLKGLLGASYANLGQFSQAKKSLNDLLSVNPHNVFALSLLAQILLNEGDAEEALPLVIRALSITPESKDLQRNLKVAQMMSGETIDYSGGDFSDVFLKALGGLRQGNYQQVFDTAQSLHKEKPGLADPLNLRAAAQLGLGDLKGALKSFEQVLALEPNNPTAAKNLATIEWRMGNLERAESVLSRYLHDSPKDEAAVLKQVVIKSQLGKVEEGTALLREALEKSPESALIRVALAQNYFDTGKYSQLLTLTSNISESELAAHPVLLALRGKVNLSRNEQILAQEDFKTYLSLLPESAHAHFLYADVLARRGKKQEARKQLESAVNVDSTYLPARLGMVKMHVHQNELKLAETKMKKLKQDFGETPAVLALDGWLALGKGDLISAEKSLSAAIKLTPSSEVSLLLFRSLWLQGEYERAFSVLNAGLLQSPDELALLEELAAAHLARGEDGEGLKIYRSILDTYPNHVLALNNTAWLSREQNLGEAIAYAERAREIAPGAASVADTLAMLLSLKDVGSRRALDLLQEAVKMAPSDQGIQLHYAELLVQRKMYAQARNVLKAIIVGSPDSPAAIQAAGTLKNLPDSGD
ncbi:MAG: PEP-CTERM system TPR-repeat protein PrsT [Gammaproteobacteria bacterium]|nr:PEP-CTERM system TPR-repeat protein PrsT [Gammaproteobacteria bacterium]